MCRVCHLVIKCQIFAHEIKYKIMSIKIILTKLCPGRVDDHHVFPIISDGKVTPGCPQDGHH